MTTIKRMLPDISRINDTNGILNFNLTKINHSFVNALRRTILSDIPVPVFVTTPYEANNCDITVNTSRLNNDILKQRLSCIPIHIKDFEGIENLQVEVDVENTTESFIYVTTKDFKIKDLATDKYLTNTDKIFPPDPFTKDYILFNRLRPSISKNIPGEKLAFTCKISISNASINGAFNTVSTCTYSFEDDVKLQNKKWEEHRKTLDSTAAEEKIEKKNWFLHHAKKYYLKNSFNFIVESLGVFDNAELIKKACSIITTRLDVLKTSINNSNVISPSKTTLDNSYDIILKNEDYTIGKIIEYVLFEDYYNKGNELMYVGFSKKHPHDTDSVIRIAFRDDNDSDIDNVKTIFNHAIEQCTVIIANISDTF